MRLRFVGSGDASGSGGRWQTCIHLAAEGQMVLVDCGATSAEIWPLRLTSRDRGCHATLPDR